jgi:hypothetical protein
VVYFYDTAVDQRLRAWHVDGGWSRVLTARGVVVNGVLPVASTAPIVWTSDIVPQMVHSVDLEGNLVPFIDDPATAVSVVSLLR